jgi:tetratricopeptide (TPR) repeat protein
MMFALLLALQSAGAAPVEDGARYRVCLAQATEDPARGIVAATEWRLGGGGFLARQCLGVAYANQQRWASAAAAFEDAAREAQNAKDGRADDFWAQAGNAWLAANDPAKAVAALDAAISAGRLTGLALGEAQLDRARAQVALGDQGAARTALDKALVNAAADPLAWLLSATLARRAGDLDRAKKDIAGALSRSPDDASVQLEAGNIAALAGDEAGAKEAWQRAVQLAPGTPVASSASAALAQFGGEQR